MLLSVVHNASEFLNGSDKTIKIENTYVDDKAIPSILRNNTILNFPIEGQSLELQAVQFLISYSKMNTDMSNSVSTLLRIDII